MRSFTIGFQSPDVSATPSAGSPTPNRSFTISGARVERHNLRAGKLSPFAAQLRDDNARYLAAFGRERRNVVDVRYAGRAARWDWDPEAMAQGGHVDEKKIRRST